MADDVVQTLLRHREELQGQIDSIDGTLAVLTGEGELPTPREDRPQVGDDKVEMVLEYLKHLGGHARQADLTKSTKLNSGTVSTALRAARIDGLVKEGPKVDRSPTWTLIKTSK